MPYNAVELPTRHETVSTNILSNLAKKSRTRKMAAFMLYVGYLFTYRHKIWYLQAYDRRPQAAGNTQSIKTEKKKKTKAQKRKKINNEIMKKL